MSDTNGVDNQHELDEKHDAEEKALRDKANEYIQELVGEKHNLDSRKNPNAARLLDQEIQKVHETGKPLREYKYVNIYREKPIKVSIKVLVPVREHPKFNFVGKLLGPKGNSLKRLQEETMCKMAVLGRGSMKDRQKEEELRQTMDPKYAHLSDDLHVVITAVAPPAEAHARIAFALAEVRKYFIPDSNDNIRQEQMREMGLDNDHPMTDGKHAPNNRGSILRSGNVRPGMFGLAPPPGPRGMGRPPMAPQNARAPPPSQPQTKAKVFSILDRARVAMDQSYGHYSPGGNDEMYPPPASRYGNSYDYEEESGPRSSYNNFHKGNDYPGQRSMKFEDGARPWKTYKTATGASADTRYRSAPYARPTK